MMSVRIPAWVVRSGVRADVRGVTRRLFWAGNYLVFDDLKPGDDVVVRFPIGEARATYTAASGTPDEQVYACAFRGGTLVDISPRDESPTSYPLYLRDHMRKAVAPLREVTRYVSDATVLRW